MSTALLLPRSEKHFLVGRLHRPAGRTSHTSKQPKRQRLIGLDGQPLTRGSVRKKSRILVDRSNPTIITRSKTIELARTLEPGGKVQKLAARTFYNTTIAPPVGTGTDIWFSDARNGTGTTDANLHDGTKWGGTLSGGSEKTLMSVVSSSGLNFPTTNVWKINYLVPRASPFNYQIQTALTSNATNIPDVGEYWYLRFYYRTHAMADLQQSHWFQATSIASWELKHTGNGSTTSDFRLVTNAGAAYDDLLNYRVTLAQDTTYRVEIRLQRYASGQCKISIRMYDGATLAFTNSDFLSFNNVTTLAAQNPDIPVTDNDFLNFDMGNNDPGPDALTGNFYFGAGRIKISTSPNDWIGAYDGTGFEA